ncbi:hypothetical protein KW818_24235, partial [Enterobacter quasiroggenkampii]|nr:hypothetical protein [Enterobacter quasiroggenkampii]
LAINIHGLLGPMDHRHFKFNHLALQRITSDSEVFCDSTHQDILHLLKEYQPDCALISALSNWLR